MQALNELPNKLLFCGSEKDRTQGQRGVALLIVIICSILLTLLGLSLTLSTTTAFVMSTESEAREKALLIADAGFNLAKDSLRAQELPTLVSTTQTGKQYLSYVPPTDPTALSYFNRNPMPLDEAINIDFASSPAGTPIAVSGLLTPPEGVPLGTGRYFARLSPGSGDDEVVLRVMGVQRVSGANAVAIIEATLKRETFLEFSSPFTAYGPNVTADFSGNSFDMDGNQHDPDGNPISGDPQPGFAVAYKDPPGNATTAANSVNSSLSGKQEDNIVGAPGDFGPTGPSIKDMTDSVPANFYDPNWLMDIVNALASIANNTLTQEQYSGIGEGAWGTQDNPQITFRDGNLEVTGGGSGAGILVVTGTLEIGGALDFDGLILSLGGDIWMHGANKTITGGIFTANVIYDAVNETYTYGDNTVTISGNSNFLFSGSGLSLASNLLPVTTLSWREVTRELEPY
ncbi:hypothetical protein MYX84_00175 [Acidobacteria bacterium AH-259-O06]|nr:hypothetical protein [Acidobacteria bacterium AH-259-O06]